MANTILITANWHTGALSQQTISRQYDNNRYVVQFVGYPEASDGNELDYYLLVWMSSAPGEKPDEIAPIQLASDQWYISNVFTQQTQQIKFQMCALNTDGTFEAHSPIFTGFVRNSLEHDGTTQDIDVSTLFDAYREYLNELIIRAGAVVIDPTLSQTGQAADAKAVGDRFERVNAQIEDIVDQTEFVKSTYTATLVIGAISNTGGNNVVFSKTIRTPRFQSIANPLAIRMLNDNWRVAVYWYAGSNPNWQFLGREPYFTAQDSRINITAETARKGFTSATFIRVVFFRWTGTEVDTDTDVTQEELSTFNDNYVFENLENLETHLADIKKDARTIYICASDSADSDKAYADYVCTGTNDEVILQQAVTSAGVTNRNIVLACGNYYIDAFPFEDASGIKVAVAIGLGTSSRTSTSVIDISGSAYGSIRKYGTSSEFIRGAIFNIRQSAYESLGSNVQYAIFAGVSTLQGKRIYPAIKAKISNIAFKLHGNQKKIICIDGWFMSALSIDNVFGMAITANSGSSTTGNIPPEDLVIPVPGCIGVRGMQGSCFGVNNLWENSFMWGFYAGFHVVGEHIIGLSLGARFCNYGYVFGIVDGEWVGTLAHPNTLINCCDELDFNLPLFGNGGRYDAIAKQSVTLIDFNIERIPSYSALGGDLAKEVTTGNGYGDITFSAVTTYGSSYVNAPFWADGHGKNFKTRNTLHAIGGSTALRSTYRPTYMQMYYDDDLGKLLIYNGSDWVDTNGNGVTP